MPKLEVIIAMVLEREVKDSPIRALILKSKSHRLSTLLIEELAYRIGGLLSL